MMSKKLRNRYLAETASQRCPDCDEPITADAINIKEGVALCSKCGELSRLSQLNTSGRSSAEILAEPPSRCSIDSGGRRVTATASTRSLPGFMFTAAFAAFWNSIISMFVLIALAGLYSNLVGPIPQWFPGPGIEDGKPIMNDKPMELGATLFLFAFLTPFIMIGTGMTIAAIMCLIGKVSVVIDEFDSYVATGFGFLQWKQRFDPRQVSDVEITDSQTETNGNVKQAVKITANKTVQFGAILSHQRVEWLWAVTRELLVAKKDTSQAQHPPGLEWLSKQRG